MSNKTPFELRFEILSMVNDYYAKTAEVSNTFALEAFKTAVELGKASAQDWEKFAVKPPYDMTDVLKYAESLYSFVNKKESK
jgi:hypothetical protein